MMRNSTTDNSKTIAYLLLAAAAFFIFNRWFGFLRLDIGTLWPLFIIIPGAAFLYAAHTGDESESRTGLYFPGMIITGTGLILLYQMWSGHWESWAYAWTLYPAFVGLAMEMQARRLGNRRQMAQGSEFVRWALTGFGIGFFFFEILIFGNSAWLPIILIAAALILLYRGRRSGRSFGDFTPDSYAYKGKRDDVYRNGANGSKSKRDLTEEDERMI
jgi:hypothetical protein